jgi:stage III sporulation protein AC
MDVDLIFKIAAIGIIVSVLNQVLIRSGGRTGNDDHLLEG